MQVGVVAEADEQVEVPIAASATEQHPRLRRAPRGMAYPPRRPPTISPPAISISELKGPTRPSLHRRLYMRVLTCYRPAPEPCDGAARLCRATVSRFLTLVRGPMASGREQGSVARSLCGQVGDAVRCPGRNRLGGTIVSGSKP
jgi:hypothetical protein